MEPGRSAVIPQTLNLVGAAPSLQGTRCRDCRALYFPAVVSCRNPDCAGKSVEPARIEGRGSLYSYTIQRYRPPPLFAIEPWEPYALGLIDVEDGLRIMGIIDAPFDDIRIGMSLRLSTRTLSRTDDEAVVTHVFTPHEGVAG